jgi:hypothetical protein
MKVNSDLNNCAIRLKPSPTVRKFNNLSGDVWFVIVLTDNKDTIAQNATRKHNLHRYVKPTGNLTYNC